MEFQKLIIETVNDTLVQFMAGVCLAFGLLTFVAEKISPTSKPLKKDG